VSYEEFEVEVTKGSGPLGLKVMGGADTTLKSVLIKEIVPNTQADIDGQLRPGDCILKVTTQSTTSLQLLCITNLNTKYSTGEKFSYFSCIVRESQNFYTVKWPYIYKF